MQYSAGSNPATCSQRLLEVSVVPSKRALGGCFSRFAAPVPLSEWR
jgi:hypothetical protein